MSQASRPNEWLPGTYLARLTPEARTALLGLGGRRVVRAGEPLTRQGDRCADVFLLKSNTSGTAVCAKVTRLVRNGAEALLAIRVVGDVIGEGAALRADTTRSATVTACSDVVVQVVEQRRFLRYLDETPQAWHALCALISDRLEWANRRRLDFAAYDVRVRLARVLLELVESHGVAGPHGIELGVDVSQEELGRLIGAKPDAVGGALRTFRNAGLVTSRYRGVRVCDLTALHAVADRD
ncbi:Crp/Fnr family transcriptional regulator [Saccharothrix obliqua]|uniref:Crp/Fnr family transcriptional regulator n=1 Tax=Saccharothrix obliqua TaxID=2861747 RepID=UPI001C5D5EFA|nr:Crp/Fnr family transcriptional regulator [Saccharothrix obliqua]MBW4719678.1 Crp/Fnr family transcriptional regulator [Saccharothrix obliqua]